MRRQLSTFLLLSLVALVAVGQPDRVYAQDSGSRLGTVKRGGRASFEPTGPGVLFDALDPAVRKWYVPHNLYTEYQWKHSQHCFCGRSVSIQLITRLYY